MNQQNGGVEDNAYVYIAIEGDDRDPRFAAHLAKQPCRLCGRMKPTFTRAVAEQIVAWNNLRSETDEENPVMEFDGDVLRITFSGMFESAYRPDEHGRYAVGIDDGWDWKQSGEAPSRNLAPLSAVTDA